MDTTTTVTTSTTILPPMARLCQFVVLGVPVAEGSMHAFVVRPKVGKARAVVSHDSKGLGPWRQAIAWQAHEAWPAIPVEGPVSVEVDFYLPRPASHFLPVTAKRPERAVRTGAPSSPATRPDLDKLVRAVLDGITGTIVGDDGQVVLLVARKVYGVNPRVEVTVWRHQ